MLIIARGQKAQIPLIETEGLWNKPGPQARRKTMNKTLILAAVTAISLTAGAAMAQETGAVIDYWGQKNVEMLSRQAAPAVQSSGTLRSFVAHSQPTLEAPGLAGGGG